jgi:hypothetical protein
MVAAGNQRLPQVLLAKSVGELNDFRLENPLCPRPSGKDQSLDRNSKLRSCSKRFRSTFGINMDDRFKSTTTGPDINARPFALGSRVFGYVG